MTLFGLKSFRHGIHPLESKDETSGLAIRQFPFAPVLVVPLVQHMGKPSLPSVREGERVVRGQRIARPDGTAGLRRADLSAASLWHSDCKDACFDHCNLEEADLDFTNLDGCTFRGAKVRKAIFPYTRLSLEEVMTSVRTGRKVRMTSRGLDDD